MKEDKKRGFTLIELLVCLLIISIIFISFCKIITFAVIEVRRSKIRSELIQCIENEKNRLLSKTFDSIELAVGKRVLRRGNVKLENSIKSVSKDLKRIKIKAFFRSYTQSIFFYKSNLIMELNNEPWI